MLYFASQLLPLLPFCQKGIHGTYDIFCAFAHRHSPVRNLPERNPHSRGLLYMYATLPLPCSIISCVSSLSLTCRCFLLSSDLAHKERILRCPAVSPPLSFIIICSTIIRLPVSRQWALQDVSFFFSSLVFFPFRLVSFVPWPFPPPSPVNRYN